MSRTFLDISLYFFRGENMNTIERIKQICKERNIPISRLERECGFGNGYIASKRTGMLPADRLITVSEYLKVSYGYLLSGKEPTDEQGKDIRLKQIIECYNILNEKGKELLFDVATGFSANPCYVDKKTDSSKAG